MSDTGKLDLPPPGGEAVLEKAPPEHKHGKPPHLEPDQGRRSLLRSMDAEIEQELEAAMGGLSGKELYGEPQRQGKPAEPAAQGRKKGRVVSVHGPDVFVEVPG